MDEAEALCSRIGVMVSGQLRALGSKQHLKIKFGDGYELIVKLRPEQSANAKESLAALCQNLTTFLGGHFPTVQLMNINASLVTYRLEGVVSIARVFSLLQEQKDRLGVEDYSITQPTLEQVFIHIVNQTNDQLALLKGQVSNEQRDPSSSKREASVKIKGGRKALLMRTRAKLGCSDPCLRISIILFAVGGLIAIIVGAFVGVQASDTAGAVLVTVGIISLIVVFVQICMLCCITCRLPLAED